MDILDYRTCVAPVGTKMKCFNLSREFLETFCKPQENFGILKNNGLATIFCARPPPEYEDFSVYF